MTDVRTLKGRNQAHNIEKHINVAFWTGETPDDPGYHLRRAHEEFLKLAEELGYKVEKL